jgi:hypothetical protein
VERKWWYHLQAVGHGMKRLHGRETGVCNLLAVGHVMRLPGRDRGQCHSLAVGYGIKCDEITWEKGMALTF